MALSNVLKSSTSIEGSAKGEVMSVVEEAPAETREDAPEGSLPEQNTWVVHETTRAFEYTNMAYPHVTTEGGTTTLSSEVPAVEPARDASSRLPEQTTTATGTMSGTKQDCETTNATNPYVLDYCSRNAQVSNEIGDVLSTYEPMNPVIDARAGNLLGERTVAPEANCTMPSAPESTTMAYPYGFDSSMSVGGVKVGGVMPPTELLVETRDGNASGLSVGTAATEVTNGTKRALESTEQEVAHSGFKEDETVQSEQNLVASASTVSRPRRRGVDYTIGAYSNNKKRKLNDSQAVAVDKLCGQGHLASLPTDQQLQQALGVGGIQPGAETDGNASAAIPEPAEPFAARPEESVVRVTPPINVGEAAIHCLFVLSNWKGGTDQWPKSSGAMSNFIQNQKGASRLSFWIQKCKREGLAVHSIRKLLVQRLVEMDVIKKGKKDKFTWKENKVQAYLVGTDAKRAGNQEAELNDVQRLVPPKKSRPTNVQRLASPNSKSNALDVTFVETTTQLQALKEKFPFSSASSSSTGAVAVDCEGVPYDLFLIQVGTPSSTFVFDCVKLGSRVVCEFLGVLLKNSNITKLFHDLHNDAAALASIGGVNALLGTLDTQLAAESLTGQLHIGFNELMDVLGQKHHPTKHKMKERMKNGKIFSQRPLPRDVLQYAVDDVRLLIGSFQSIRKKLGGNWDAVLRASDLRAHAAATNGGARRICFDVANNYAVASHELLFVSRPGDMMSCTPLEVSNEPETLLAMLPEDLSSALTEHTRFLSDVVLDKGRRAHAWIGGERLMLGDESRLVGLNEIEAIVEKLGGFGSDNRAGLERQLHRISAIRNREAEIIGLTLRFGRHVSGNAGIISDLLFSDPTKSILFLGEPGAGKTTVVREVTRLLSERSNVCVVDTSNEIAGDGDIPHPCVGFARRMMVPGLDQQSAVMIECVQNHTPEIMVIDEIGRLTEVEAARTCKNRGVRLIASAHGDLRKLIKNPKLRGLIGGLENVTVGDMRAMAVARKNPGVGIRKTQAERAGPPTFDILVELKRGAHDDWRIVLDSGDAVDRVLRGEQYKAQRRTRNPETGDIHLELEMV